MLRFYVLIFPCLLQDDTSINNEDRKKIEKKNKKKISSKNHRF